MALRTEGLEPVQPPHVIALNAEDAALLKMCLLTIDQWLRKRTDILAEPPPPDVVSSAIVTVDMLLGHLRSVKAVP